MPDITAAVEAALGVARVLGLSVDRPVMLRSTNNVVVAFQPAQVVAKIAPAGRNQLGWELDVASTAFRHGGPVVGPSELVDPTVHQSDGWEMTFWPYHAQAGASLNDADVGRALGHLHSALDEAVEAGEVRLPDWDRAIRDVLLRLDDSSFAGALKGGDRDLLKAALTRFHEISARTAGEHSLHGSPHAYNALTVEGEVRFIDLETACRGPVEWDLGYLDPAAASEYSSSYDRAALDISRLVISAMVSALCWEGIDRGPDMRDHAEHHLAMVRAATDP